MSKLLLSDEIQLEVNECTEGEAMISELQLEDWVKRASALEAALVTSDKAFIAMSSAWTKACEETDEVLARSAETKREFDAFKACHDIGEPEDGYRELVWRDAADFYEGEGSDNLIKDLREALKTLVMQREAHFHTAAAWDRARELTEPKAPVDLRRSV